PLTPYYENCECNNDKIDVVFIIYYTSLILSFSLYCLYEACYDLFPKELANYERYYSAHSFCFSPFGTLDRCP
ncbi:10128_t:CDS:1, partial [Ambispora leptoticha]